MLPLTGKSGREIKCERRGDAPRPSVYYYQFLLGSVTHSLPPLLLGAVGAHPAPQSREEVLTESWITGLISGTVEGTTELFTQRFQFESITRGPLPPSGR